jgi:hypothetical protein
LNRSHGLRISIEAMGADQALWEAALEALGYPSNKRGFRQMARRLTWPVAAELAGRLTSEDFHATVLWAARFGDRPPSAPALGGAYPEWSQTHGRPANHPRVRAAAVGLWAARWRGAGPAATFASAVLSANAASDLALAVGVMGEDGRKAAVGAARAREISVNVLLPGAHAIGSLSRDRRLMEKVTALFRAHPLTQRNSIESEAASLLKAAGAPHHAHTACEQQGLLHIYRLMTAATRPDRQLPLL